MAGAGEKIGAEPLVSLFPQAHLLGACLIVKNEAPRIARCLASVRPWVSEMIVVDTGSSDATPERAAEMGASVFSFPWCDDFSAARNASLRYASRPWVLVVDADDVLEVCDTGAFGRTLEKDSEPFVYSVPYVDKMDDGSTVITPAVRLFRRNKPGMRYTGEVHEQLQAVAQGELACGHAHFLQLAHDGHTSAAVAGANKFERNLRLARKMVSARPNAPFSWFCLGLSCRPCQTNRRRPSQLFSGPAFC